MNDDNGDNTNNNNNNKNNNNNNTIVKRIVLVHTGVGLSIVNENKEKILLRKTFKWIKKNLKEREDQHWNLFNGIGRQLEKSPLTNTGYGSCICNDGNVRCDSSVISVGNDNSKNDNQLIMGAVVCNSSKYPLQDATKIVIERSKYLKDKKDKDIIVSPIVIVGNIIPNLSLISPQMKKIYKLYGNSKFNNNNNNKEKEEEIKGLKELEKNYVQDTIGVLLFEQNNLGLIRCSVGSSSGGSLFCIPGRIGSAGIIGAGCWVELIDDICVGVLVSGQGESIITGNIAKTVCKKIIESIKNEDEKEQEEGDELFINTPMLIVKEIIKTFDEIIGIVGLVVSKYESNIFYGHNSNKFIIASLENSQRKNKIIIETSTNTNNSTNNSTNTNTNNNTTNRKVRSGQWKI
jgi:taspase (threonine aspartase 1)